MSILTMQYSLCGFLIKGFGAFCPVPVALSFLENVLFCSPVVNELSGLERVCYSVTVICFVLR